MAKRKAKKVAKRSTKRKIVKKPKRKNPLRKLSDLDRENLKQRLDRANSWIRHYSDLYSEALSKNDIRKINSLKKELEDSIRVRDAILDELSSGTTYGWD